MKKLTGFLVLAVLVTVSLHAAGVTVTKPAAGDVWIKGTSQAILWTVVGDLPNPVRISLRDPTTSAEVAIIQDNVPNTGSHVWQIPGSIADGQYKVRVKVKDTQVVDESDVFTIASSAPQTSSVTVTKPAAGDKWIRSKSYTITWTKNGSMPNEVKIRLMDKYSTNVVREIVGQTANTGAYLWTIPSDIPAGDYRVRIKVKDVQVSDDSDTFSLSLLTMVPGRTPVKKKTFIQAPNAIGILWKEYTKPGVFKNWGNPLYKGNIPPPPASWAGRPSGYPAGASPNDYAHVGYDYFFYQNNNFSWWITFCYRSQVTFYLSEFQGMQDNLVSAKMHVKQVSCLKNNDNSSSCGVGLFYFLAPWTDWNNGQISGLGISALLPSHTEYTLDITNTVRKWLDGSMTNNGLLMTSREVKWGEQPKICFSAFEVSLTLRFKNE